MAHLPRKPRSGSETPSEAHQPSRPARSLRSVQKDAASAGRSLEPSLSARLASRDLEKPALSL